jgi:ribosomal-protein-alanine N-acetyltransferase
MSKYLQFESDRLWLRPTSEEDADFIVAVFNTPGALKYIGDRNIHTCEDALSFIRSRTLKQLRERGYANYTLVEKESGAKVGVCGLYARLGLENVDLGYAMLPEFERRGFASEAGQRLMQAAKEDFDLHVLDAITHPHNVASMALLEKLGFDNLGEISLEGYDGPSVLFRKS